jgi:hypothetical protein
MNTYNLDPLKLKPDKLYLQTLLNKGFDIDTAPAGTILGGTFEAAAILADIYDLAAKILDRINRKEPPPSFRKHCNIKDKISCNACTELWSMEYQKEIGVCNKLTRTSSQATSALTVLLDVTANISYDWSNWTRQNVWVAPHLSNIYTTSFKIANDYPKVYMTLKAFEHHNWDGK